MHFGFGLGFAVVAFVSMVLLVVTDNSMWQFSAILVIIGLLVAVLEAIHEHSN